VLHEIIIHFVKVRNRLQNMSTNTDHGNYWRCYLSNVLLSDTVKLIQQDGRKWMRCWLTQEVTAFWEIEYYFVTMMFSKVFWYSMGSCKTNNVKIHQAVQRRFRKNAVTLSTCSKNIKRRISQHSCQWMLHSNLHISLHDYCEHHDGRKGCTCVYLYNWMNATVWIPLKTSTMCTLFFIN